MVRTPSSALQIGALSLASGFFLVFGGLFGVPNNPPVWRLDYLGWYACLALVYFAIPFVGRQSRPHGVATRATLAAWYPSLSLVSALLQSGSAHALEALMLDIVTSSAIAGSATALHKRSALSA